MVVERFIFFHQPNNSSFIYAILQRVNLAVFFYPYKVIKVIDKIFNFAIIKPVRYNSLRVKSIKGSIKEVKMSNKSQIFRSLAELKQVSLVVSLPELPEVELGDLTELEAQAEKIRGSAAQTRAWTRSTLGQLELVKGAKREVRELVAIKVAKVQQDLANLLSHEIPAYRRAAWLGFLEYEFSGELHSRQEVEILLENLVKTGRLKEDPDGALKAYGRTYSVHPDSRFEEPEVAEVKRLLAALLGRVFQETGKAREEKAQKLLVQGSSDLTELLTGKPGKYVVEVPAEKVVQNGQEFWRGGGVLLVESNGEDIKPLDASGSIEEAVQETRELGVFLKLHTLNWTKPPVVPGLDPERGKKVQLLWYLLKRTVRHKKEMTRLAAQRQALGGKATISPQGFFLEREPGSCLAEFQGTWQNPDGTPGPTNLFFLVERKEKEGVKRICIAETPDHLKEFLAPCLDREFQEEGNKFERVAQPLRALLMAIHGQVFMVAKDAEKAGQIANGK